MSKEITSLNLPVYKSSYELLIYTFESLRELKREYKFTVGEEIKREMIELLMNIYRANKIKDVERERKLKKVFMSIENIEIIRLLYRVLFDIKEIDVNVHVEVNLKIEYVRRQLIAWEKKLMVKKV